jgi:hypothetical protein
MALQPEQLRRDPLSAHHGLLGGGEGWGEVRDARCDYREISARAAAKEGWMKLPQTGGCQWGEIPYEITEAPQWIYKCHCVDCQRLTRSAFSRGVERSKVLRGNSCYQADLFNAVHAASESM